MYGSVRGASRNRSSYRDLPSYAIVGGNSAKIIRMRFDDNTIEKLLKIKWWDWDA